MSAPVVHLLDFEQPHILAGIGTSSNRDGDPLIFCRFVPQLERSQIGTPVFHELPIAHLADLRPGDVIHPDGRVSAYPDSRTYTTRIRVGEKTSYSAERSTLLNRGLLPKRKFLEDGDAAGTERSYWHVAPSLDLGVDYVVCLSFLIFLAYQAPNSRLASAYYSNEVIELTNALQADARNRDSYGHCQLHLGKGRLVSDAVPLARILFDKTGRAIEEMRRTANGIMLANRSHENFAFSCGFPFDGVTTLTYRAIEHTDKVTGIRTHIVLNITGCSFPLPWEQLQVDMEQPIAKNKDGDRSKGHGGGYKFEDFDDIFVPLDPSAPRPKGGDELVAKTANKVVFSQPGAQAITIRRREVERIVPTGKGPGVRKPRNLSGHKGTYAGDQDSQQVQVASNGDGETQTEESNTKENTLSPVAAFRSVTESLIALTGDKVRHEGLHLMPSVVNYNGWLLNEIPERPKPRGRTWATIKEEQQRRCLLVAEVTNGTHYLYVFEILRNPGESFSTLVLYRSDGQPVAEYELARVFMEIIKKEGIPEDKAIEAIGIRVQRVRHPSRGSSTRLLRNAIVGRFGLLSLK